MSPYSHPVLTLLWMIALACKGAFLWRTFRAPMWLFAFAAWAFAWTFTLMVAAFLGADTAYVVTYWTGLYVYDLLGVALGLALTGRALKINLSPPLRVPGVAVCVMAPLYTVTAILLYWKKGGGWESGNAALQLWMVGSLALIWTVTKLQRQDRMILLGLLALFGFGWLLSGWILFLAPHWNLSRAGYVIVDCAVDATVFGWWAWNFTDG